MKGNLWGYLNMTGEIIISPRYAVAGEFSDGMAPVRLKARYGFINTRGEFTIEPKYDIANKFHDGIAKVYIDGKPYIIDKKGKILFDHDFEHIDDFGGKTYSIVKTKDSKYGIVNRKGKLIVDTVYSQITDYHNDVIVLKGKNKEDWSKDEDEYDCNYKVNEAVIDTTGKMIIPSGKYINIKICKNGFLKVQDTNKKDGKYSYEVITKQGRNVITCYDTGYSLQHNANFFRNNIGIIAKHDYRNKKESYTGAITSEGNLLFKSSEWETITFFENGRAFASDTNDIWYLIDSLGNKVVGEGFSRIINDRSKPQEESIFYDGIAMVQNNMRIYGIDSNGEIRTPILYRKWGSQVKYRNKNFIIFLENIDEEPYYGFWNFKTNKVLTANYTNIDFKNEDDKIVALWYKDNIGYCDTNGQIIYLNRSETLGKRKLDVDFMMRGYSYASSVRKDGLDGLGGWGQSDNGAYIIENSKWLKNREFKVILDASEETTWSKYYKGYNLYVVNATADTLYFEAQDSRIEMVLQAKNSKGEWRDIEYLPNSWCGNSDHTLFLAPKELWKFVVPKYEGHVKTKLRAKLLYKKQLFFEEQNQEEESPKVEDFNVKKLSVADSVENWVIRGSRTHSTIYRDYSKEKTLTIYSNEINGYINPGQFWFKREYIPQGIMDPYKE